MGLSRVTSVAKLPGISGVIKNSNQTALDLLKEYIEYSRTLLRRTKFSEGYREESIELVNTALGFKPFLEVREMEDSDERDQVRRKRREEIARVIVESIGSWALDNKDRNPFDNLPEIFPDILSKLEDYLRKAV